MARADAFSTQIKSPVEFYLEWNSSKKCFEFYDKDSGTNMQVPLPVRAVYLDEMATVKGWHKASNSAIFSNEVRSTKTQEFAVKSFKSGDIAKGVWKEIKDKVNNQGGKYHTSMYVLFEGRLVNLSLHGVALHAWSEFAKDNKRNLLGNFLDITGFTSGNTGGINWNAPSFALGPEIDEATSVAAEEIYENLQSYFSSKSATYEPGERDMEVESEELTIPTATPDPFAPSATPASAFPPKATASPFPSAPIPTDDLPF